MKKFTIIKVVLIIVIIININKNYLPFFMKKYKFIFIILIAFGCTIENIDPNEKKVNSLIAEIIDSNNLPGLSVSIMKNGEISFDRIKNVILIKGKELNEYTWTPLKQSAIGVSELRLPEPPPTFQTID